ncbi:hypothetical protein [Levilactobacillus acidifarinae]|uniref:Uncharacterized protein n=1 Tax=Levilactobacillus acidifarinae DSM 19394 = JCM 15949 TaxID=1423715 RepID=A0A0R1LK04_9LACO|nr:hypothetical protein [Levilactobacillus acidifarinae]KRK96143.1 hypothetical protein FD25_GL002607 [Levilactobacillus acidifarinae DSM 19394]GEO69504.1 hypothetical protein LAC03_14140 [Levilactobacillus acidifarinae]
MTPAPDLTPLVEHDVHAQGPLLRTIFGRRFALYRNLYILLTLLLLGLIGFVLGDVTRLSGLPLSLVLAQPQALILLLTFLALVLVGGGVICQAAPRARQRRFVRQLVASLQPDAPAGTAHSQVLAANLNLLTLDRQALRFKTSEVRTLTTAVPAKTLLVIPLYRRQGPLDHAQSLTMVYVDAAELAHFNQHLAVNKKDA